MPAGASLFLPQLIVILLLAVTLGRLAARFGQPPIVGELAAGLLLGPSVLGAVIPGWSDWFPPPGSGKNGLLDGVSQLGVLLLVGLTAAHIDLEQVRRRAGTILRIGVWALCVPFALGLSAGYVVPSSLLGPHASRAVFAIYLGVALCVSAIPVIARTLTDMRLLGHRVGQIILVCGVLEDAVGWILLALVGAMAATGFNPGALGLSAAELAGLVALAVIVRRPIRRLLRTVGRSGEPAPTMTITVVIILAGAFAANAMGLEAVVGAFLAGTAVGVPGGADERHLASLHTVVIAVLAPVFLAAAGLNLDLGGLAKTLPVALGVLALAVLGKLTGGFIGARTSGLPPWESFAIGAGLNCRGVVEVIVATVGLRLGILTPTAYTIVVLVAVATSLMAPPLLRAAMNRTRAAEPVAT